MFYLVRVKTEDGPKPYQVQGRLIEIVPFGKFIVHKALGNKVFYSMSEPSTGLLVAISFLHVGEMVEATRNYLNEKGLAAFQRTVEEHCNQYGVLQEV